ncbi:MAG: ammonium transporter [Nitrospirae bacterium]|nr:MAG: ammonium transporter [Nitrospirota bacterium]
MEPSLKELASATNVLFVLLGAVMILAMHAGFAFLEVGSVRSKNQVNALVKILTDWSISTVVYFFVGFPIAQGIGFLDAADVLAGNHGLQLVRYFFYLTFAACIPAIISGGIAERARFWPQCLAGAIFAGLLYPAFERVIWWQTDTGLQAWLASTFGAQFHDYAGSVVVHSFGGWIALPAVLLLGPRIGRYEGGKSHPIPASSILWLAMGSWILAVGWFGFNVMSAGAIGDISGLVAVNSLLAMVGGALAAVVASRTDPGFVHNGALAGLIAICAGSDRMHPVGALVTGAVGGLIFVYGYTFVQERLRIDDVLGVWPLHGVTGTWGGIACGIFGAKALGGRGGVALASQVIGSLAAIAVALVGSGVVYGLLKATVGIRLGPQEELQGADLSIHKVGAEPERELMV